MGMVRLFASDYSDCVFCAVIVLNAIIMFVQAQYEGLDNAHSVAYKNASAAEATWPGAGEIFDICEWAFGAIFALEIAGKMLAIGFKFPRQCWNLFDTSVVFCWVIERVMFGDMGFNPTALRMIRLARLLRLVRLFRWGGSDVFGPLYLIVKAISSSLVILAWSLMVLLLLMCVTAVIMCSVLGNFIRDDNMDLEARTLVYEGWGSFTRAGLTMLEITLANWGPPCWLLTNEVNEWYSLFFVVYKCSIGFAVVQVILSVFIQQTFKVASLDENVMINEKRLQSLATIRNLDHLFGVLDKSGDGFIDHLEFSVVKSDPVVKMWFSALGVDVVDIDELFTLLDDNHGRISRADFIDGIRAMRGLAKCTDILDIKRAIKRVESKLKDLDSGVSRVPPLIIQQANPSVTTFEI